MIFEYDENKSLSNKSKHGIDFNQTNIRIISVRSSRDKEKKLYASIRAR
ncbi:MAG: hypothetical protein HF962_06665 [Sulfurovum sp.]|nr:hypothetical protein [Sulfurovum sp.]